MNTPASLRLLLCVIILTLIIPCRSRAYSVLTHEALIDASWDKHILPLLKQKYPLAGSAELKTAHAYTYGGCLIADMGYFPFGSKYFTDLAHYVRSGDFVEALLSESENLNEYAFALGALCHYMGDKYGHSLGTNLTVPIVYPKMGARFGPVVTYDDNNISHSRVEIAFDVLQVARGNYLNQSYHDFIGFNVSKPVLERAFLKTYGQDITNVFGDFDIAVGTYRWAVKSLMPDVTRSAWILKKSDIIKQRPNATEKEFHYKMTRKDYKKEFGNKRRRASLKTEFLSLLIDVLPKVGFLKALKFKDVGPVGETLFIKSFDTVLTHYHAALAVLQKGPLRLNDVDYDTGKPTAPGEYRLADITYDNLVCKLDKNKFEDLTAPLKTNILNFYKTANTALLAKEDGHGWKKTSAALQDIKKATTLSLDSLKNKDGRYYKLNEPVLTRGSK